MKVFEGPFEGWPTPERRSAITVGVYDGVHVGHQALIRSLGARTATADLDLVVVTFRRHPATVLAPQRVPLQLTTLEQKLDRFEALGVDTVGVLDFDERVRRLSAEAFVGEVLVASLHAAVVSVGTDFRFGYRQQGDIEALEALGLRHGFEVAPVELVGADEPVSATSIREVLANGDVAAAAEMLGRPFELRGVVVAGDGRGRSIGVPTANLALAPHQAIPRHGVYAVRVGVAGVEYPGVANVGVRPTFDGHHEVVEVHLLGVELDLYGTELAVAFVSRIRDERRFSGVDELVGQIGRDVAAAADLLR